MPFFKIVFTILGIIFTINIIQTVVEYNIRGSVYACEDVTKQDPIDVQKICSRRWKRK
jgi:F0F1-type ATP synthase assembly protein I